LSGFLLKKREKVIFSFFSEIYYTLYDSDTRDMMT